MTVPVPAARARRALAAAVLAVSLLLALADCHNPTVAPVPPPPACPSGQNWAPLPDHTYGCTSRLPGGAVVTAQDPARGTP